MFLFGKTRHDQRWDLIAGAIFNRASCRRLRTR